jgi:hypothetical protein
MYYGQQEVRLLAGGKVQGVPAGENNTDRRALSAAANLGRLSRHTPA